MASGCTIMMTADTGSLPCAHEEREAFLAHRRLYEIDQYYDSIKEETFKTEFLSLTVDEVRAWRIYNKNGKMTEGENELLSNLILKLDKKIKSVSNQGAFVRLSTRSPKDAADKIPERVVPLLAHHLQNQKRSLEIPNPNQDMLALRNAFFDCMKVRSGEEAMSLFTLSSRAVSDIIRALDNLDVSTWNLKLIIREFVPMPVAGELRGFVFEKKLTALSQYYCDSYFSELSRKKDHISEKVQSYYERIKEKIQIPSFIIDFVVMENGEVKIVELNPWSAETGACLFDWKRDLEQLEQGPFEFRCLDSEPEHVQASLIPWNALLESAKKSLAKKPEKTKPVPYCLITIGVVMISVAGYWIYQSSK